MGYKIRMCIISILHKSMLYIAQKDGEKDQEEGSFSKFIYNLEGKSLKNWRYGGLGAL